MNTSSKLPVLRRKLSRPASPLDQAGSSPAKTLRLAIARAADDAANLEASVTGFVEEQVGLADIVSGLAGVQLIFMTKGPGGAMGLAIWDMQAISALIEQLITGRVIPSPAQERVPTRTDAAVIAGILGHILKNFDAGLSQIADVPPVSGFRQTGLLEDARAVSMALEDVLYRHYRISVDFGNGAKTGELRLIYPWSNENVKRQGASEGPGWAAAWQDAVSGARTPVYAILQRLTMPLNKVSELKVGMTIPVSPESIAAISLEGADRQSVASGRLGQSNGYRAVRIAPSVPPAITLDGRASADQVAAVARPLSPAKSGENVSQGEVISTKQDGENTATRVNGSEDADGLAVN